jgi:urease accessory protein
MKYEQNSNFRAMEWTWISHFAFMSLVWSELAEAHPALNHVGNFAQGTIHPFTGWDHITAMIALGIWVAQRRIRYSWILLLSFAFGIFQARFAAMGAFYGSFLEMALTSSIIIFGLIISGVIQLPATISFGLFCLAMFFHGQLHGIEVPSKGVFAPYMFGVCLGTFMLFLGGVAAGVCARYSAMPQTLRHFGYGVLLVGIFRLFTGTT